MKFSIEFDSRQAVYYSGHTITGRVILDTDEEITRVRCVSIIFRGWAVVRWTEGSGEHQRTYHNEEEYFKLQLPLHGKVKNETTTNLPTGHHSYPFQIVVPPDIPSSYQSSVGNVCYTLTANIDRAWGFDKNTVVYITVHRPLDLNTLPNITGRAEGSASKNLCCLCCKSGPIEGTVHADRRGYVPGDTIVFSGQIENRSSRTISNYKGVLVMQAKYIASKVNTVEHKLEKVKFRDQIRAGGSSSVTGKLLIPAGPPSFLDKCNIIVITYFVQLVVNPSGPAIRLRVPAEIVIGDIPLKNMAEGYGMGTSFSLPSSDVGNPGILYGNNAGPALPQVTFAESPFARPLSQKNDENTQVQNDFAPVYSYYKWDQTNPADRFTV